MKPHIALTIADLQSERERLDEMITVLEAYGRADERWPSTAEAAPSPNPEPKDPPPPRELGRVKPARKQRRPARRTKPNAPPAEKMASGYRRGWIAPAVREVVEKTAGEFKARQVSELLIKAYPHREDDIRKKSASVATALCDLAERGVLKRVSAGTYVQAQGNGRIARISETERRYRQMREGINTNVPEVAVAGERGDDD